MPRFRHLAAVLGAVLLVSSVSRAGALEMRRLLVVNESDQVIYAIRLGHDVDPPEWSADLLPFNDVIDVSAGREFKIGVDPAACVSDVQATYQDGQAVVVKDVDLCTTDRVDITR